MATIRSYKELIVYQKAFRLGMEIFEVTKEFPKEEKYSLTDQVRRSSRSVAANIAEAWARKNYPKSFVNKLTDSLGEEYETEVWLDFSYKSNYIPKETHEKLSQEYDEVRKIFLSIITNPDKSEELTTNNSPPCLTTHNTPLILFLSKTNFSSSLVPPPASADNVL